MHLIGCEKHLHSSCLSNESRQPLCSTPPGDQAQGSAPMPEDGMRPGDAPRACQRQVESSAHAVAVNRRNRRSGKLSDSIHQRLSHLCEAKSLRAGECADFGKVAPAEKKLSLPVTMRHDGGFSAIFWTAAASAMMRARVRRLVPSAEVSCRIAAWFCRSMRYRLSPAMSLITQDRVAKLNALSSVRRHTGFDESPWRCLVLLWLNDAKSPSGAQESGCSVNEQALS